MPDAAFEATERQFVDLVRSTSGADIDISLYALPGIERGAGHPRLAETSVSSTRRDLGRPTGRADHHRYRAVASDVTTEPYWDSLAKLIIWAEHATFSTMLSCLAAHAALLVFDGIERQPLPEKCSGVFENDVCHPHPLLNGLGVRAAVPQSRLNDVPTGPPPCERLHDAPARRRRLDGRGKAARALPLRPVSGPSRVRHRHAVARSIVATCDGSSPASAYVPTAARRVFDADGAERLAAFRAGALEGSARTPKRISRMRRS